MQIVVHLILYKMIEFRYKLYDITVHKNFYLRRKWKWKPFFTINLIMETRVHRTGRVAITQKFNLWTRSGSGSGTGSSCTQRSNSTQHPPHLHQNTTYCQREHIYPYKSINYTDNHQTWRVHRVALHTLTQHQTNPAGMP